MSKYRDDEDDHDRSNTNNGAVLFDPDDGHQSMDGLSCDLYHVPSSQSPAESKPSSVVTFDLRGTRMRTTTETLAACEPGSLLTHLASLARDDGNDDEPIFVDCSPVDFTLVIDHLCYGIVPADAETRRRLACVADRLHMPALAAACRDGQETAPGHRAAIAEMDELAKFIMASGRSAAYCREKERERLDRCHWAIDRHHHLHKSLSMHPLTPGDRKRLCSEATMLRAYILDAKVANGKVGRAAVHWAKWRHSRIGAILTPPSSPSVAPLPSPAVPASTIETNGCAQWAWLCRSVGLVGGGVALGVGIGFGFAVVIRANGL